MTTVINGFRDAVTMTRRDLVHSVRSPGTALIGLITPVFLLFMFVYVFGGSLSVGTTYVDYVAPGILMITATYGCSMTAVRLAADMKEGIVDRFRTMAITRGSVLTGQVVGSVIRTSIECLLLLGILLLMGFRPAVDPLAWLAAAALLLLVILAVTWVTVAGALLAKSPEGASYSTILVVLLPFVSSAFARTESMPGWVRWFADNQPFTPVINALRALFMGTPVGHDWIMGVAWCAGFTILGYAGAKLLFARDRVRS
ncbi:MAG: ABC transporter permease [Candidatus Dormibacteraeota bacterium]|nr:ABC transporter permease [Candidatus Dormibacteraeota bacterium]